MKVLGIIVLVVVVLSAFAAYYAGFFYTPQITEGDSGRYTLVYRKMQGSYKNSYKPMDEVYAWLLEKDIEATKGFGLYFDKPGEVTESEMRYIAGCIVEGDHDTLIARSQYPVAVFEPVNSVIATFPYKNKMNIIAGVFKVYPAINRYIAEKGYAGNPVMEIYDVPNRKIVYIMPVNREVDLVERFYR